MGLSVIIVVYNSDDVIFNCLDSINLYNSINKNLEVIIVDNNPLSNLSKNLYCKQYNFQLTYVLNDKNRGFGAGNNRGVSIANHPRILFLNPDTILTEDIFTATIEALRTNENLVLGYTLVNSNKSRNDSYSYFFEYFYLFPLFHLIEKFSFYFINKCSLINKITWPWGAAFSLNKSTFLSAGKFDENIFLCNEEQDLIKRIPQRKIRILPLQIIHLEGHGRIVSIERYKAYLYSLHYYFKKYHINDFFFWFTFRMKLKIKHWIHPNSQCNLEKAFDEFRKENVY